MMMMRGRTAAAAAFGTTTRLFPQEIRRRRSNAVSRRRCFQIYPNVTAPRDVKIVEVGPRDGLQNEKTVVVSTEDKISLITKLAAAGCQYIEAGSFVSPKWVPSMANSVQVMQGLSDLKNEKKQKNEKLVLSCLVPNTTGLEKAIQVKADEIAIFASASEAFSQKNINCSIDESMQRFREVVQLATEHDIPIRGYLSCVVACPYQGPVLPSQVAKVLEQMVTQLGCFHEISLGDTIGVATPASTIAMLEAAQAVVEDSSSSSSSSSPRLAVHFHDTYGQALANILVSLERGIDTIDSSVAGLGGCPYAGPSASGNVATEDVLYMLHGLGVNTGIDLDAMVEAAEFITGILGRPSRSRAGLAIAAKHKLEDTK